MSKRRVVVTGLGLLTPVGNTVEESWKNIVAGKSGIAPITAFDASDFTTRISGSVKNFDVTEYLTVKDARKMDIFIHFGIAAGVQALDDSGIEVTEANAERIGVAIGSGIGGLPTIEKNRDAYVEGGPRKISPFFVPSSIINMVSGNLSIMRGLKGPNISIVSACTTGAHNIGDAARMISYGDTDVMVAGGAEMATSALGVGGFAAARALSTRNDDPEAASRPWDRDRDGFLNLADDEGHRIETRPSESAVLGVHACGFLTDRCLDFAVERGLPVTVMPCCYPYERCPAPTSVRQALGGELAFDVDRTNRLESQGHAVSWRYVPKGTTPMNRILIGTP